MFRSLGEDGGLMDVIVPGASLKGWDRVLQMVRTEFPDADFRFEGDGRTLGMDAAARDIFDPGYREHEISLLSVPFADDARAQAHFFDTDLVEFDIDPRDITGAAAGHALEVFLAKLHIATGKPVHLTPEGMHDAHIATCSREAGGVRWLIVHG